LKHLTIASSLFALFVGGALAQTAQPQDSANQPQNSAAQQQNAGTQQQNAAAPDYCANGFVASSTPQNGTMTKDQIRQMSDREFSAMDRNTDGRLSLAEFASCMARAGAGIHPVYYDGNQSAERDAAFNTADTNSDGKLDTQEYLAAAQKEFQQQSPAGDSETIPVYFIWVPTSALMQARSGPDETSVTANQAAAYSATGFDNQDANGDGSVSKAEWQGGSAGVSPDVVEQHFKILDANGDGVVTKDEYAAKWADRFAQAQQAQNMQGNAGQGESVPVWVLYVY
jgi:Ca2+-binding EF-hand superfamily protein